jgi:hypothetical protein
LYFALVFDFATSKNADPQKGNPRAKSEEEEKAIIQISPVIRKHEPYFICVHNTPSSVSSKDKSTRLHIKLKPKA